MTDTPLFLFFFLGVFHTIGGSVIGSTLRQIVDMRGEGLFQRLSMLLFGAIFGLMPLVFGLAEGTLFLLGQVALLVIVTGGVFLFQGRLREVFGNQNLIMMGFGGIFIVIGLGVTGALLRDGPFFTALILFITFCGMGGVVFGIGLRNTLKGD
jgi:hypothetical protein